MCARRVVFVCSLGSTLGLYVKDVRTLEAFYE